MCHNSTIIHKRIYAPAMSSANAGYEFPSSRGGRDDATKAFARNE